MTHDVYFGDAVQGAKLRARAEETQLDWHARQWENDKPDWDTDAKCTDCGQREKGWVAAYANVTEASTAEAEAVETGTADE